MTVPASAAVQLAAAPSATALPACAVGDLRLSFDGEDGRFAGMQHGGTLMVVRNIGASACRVPALPHVDFEGPKGAALPIRFGVPARMHPGPAVPPMGIPPGAEVTAELVWVAGDAVPGGRCYTTATISVQLGAVAIGAPFEGTFCGPASGATFGQAWLKPDATLGR